MNIKTLWPNLRLYARDCGEIDPYNAHNTQTFRGEEGFSADVEGWQRRGLAASRVGSVEGWQRWSKPSPEPRLDAAFAPTLQELACQIIAAYKDSITLNCLVLCDLERR